jgi:hypothetical protein
MVTKSPEVIASQIVKTMKNAGLTLDQMIEVLEMVKIKLRKLRQEK